MTLDDCIRIAGERSPRIRSATLNLRIAEQHQREVNAARLPNLSLLGGASYSPLRGMDPALTEGGEFNALLDIRQTMYDGGTTRVARQSSQVATQKACEGIARATAELRLEVRLAYVEQLVTQRREALMQHSIEDLEQYWSEVRSLAFGGAVPKADILKVEIQLQSEQIAREDQRLARIHAQRRLVGALGLPLDSTIVVQDTLTLPPLPARFQGSASPELRTAQLDIRAAELDVHAAQAERRPSVSLVGHLGGWTTRHQLAVADDPQWFAFLAGIQVAMPLWNAGATGARIDQQRAAWSISCSEHDALERQLDLEYRLDADSYGCAQRKLERLAAARHSANEQYRLLLAQYASGGASSLEILDAHRSLLELALQHQTAQFDVERLHAQLLRLVGE